jgi:3-hydroxyacyl-[acyl-carrier-protein] dehydratase
MESMELDINGIHEYQQNRYPYLLIDHATEIIPGVSAKGYKNLTINDWFFKCHFPGDPNMPGMLQLEAIVQLSALMVLTLPGNKGKVVYVVSGNNMKWRRKVLVGERFDIETKLLTWARGLGKCSGVASVNGEVACRAEFNIVMPEILDDFKVVK